MSRFIQVADRRSNRNIVINLDQITYVSLSMDGNRGYDVGLPTCFIYVDRSDVEHILALYSFVYPDQKLMQDVF